MAIGNNALIEIAVRMQGPAGQVMNIYDFRTGEGTTEGDAGNIAAAFWNHVKAQYRALVWVGFGNVFREITVRDLNDAQGDYGTFAVPLAEQAGNRPNLGAPIEPMPPFNACGVRLVVGSRVTRPGQKRLGWLVEQDNVNGVLQQAYVDQATALMNVLTAPILLGAPAALTALSLVVVRKTKKGVPVADQPVRGFSINTFVTSQNSRKYGRGA